MSKTKTMPTWHTPPGRRATLCWTDCKIPRTRHLWAPINLPKEGTLEEMILWRVEYGHNGPFVETMVPHHYSPSFPYMRDAVNHYKNVDPWMKTNEPDARHYIVVQISSDGGKTFDGKIYVAVQNRLPWLPKDAGLFGRPWDKLCYYKSGIVFTGPSSWKERKIGPDGGVPDCFSSGTATAETQRKAGTNE